MYSEERIVSKADTFQYNHMENRLKKVFGGNNSEFSISGYNEKRIFDFLGKIL